MDNAAFRPNKKPLSHILEGWRGLCRSWGDAIFPLQCSACGTLFQRTSGEGVFRIRWNPPAAKTASGPSADPPLDTASAFAVQMTPYLCPACITAFIPIESPLCTRCGGMFKSRKGVDHVCGRCLDTRRRFGMARAVGLYDKACMDVIHALKYKGRERLARPLSLLLLAALHRFWPVESIDLVVPVPLHIRKLRQRGFNQSFLLVKPWPAIAEEMPAGTPSPPVDDHILCRQRWTEPQTGLRRRDRMINIRDAFGVRYPQRVRGKKVLLVDDVFTTGSTVEECARVLLKAGASRVDVLTLARAA